ncbi:hypothetical protein YC2023_108034 [Brassica napus]
MRLPPDCRPSVGASAPKGTCRWLSPFGGSTVRTALNYNYHRAAVRILCRRLKYTTGYCKWQKDIVGDSRILLGEIHSRPNISDWRMKCSPHVHKSRPKAS